jgi:dTDP-4-amino-4,6-dideoxygalactose transaminase
MTIPLVDLAAQHREVADEVGIGIADVFARTAFVGGREVDVFEREYAAYVGAAHCIGAGNGTDALELALRAVGVTPGGEVILPANTFIATAEAVSRIGARPVLVDVDDEHLLIDPDRVGGAVTARTQAIVPVHLFGQTAFVEQVRQAVGDTGIPIVEDAAQAQGASRLGRSAGSLGAVAATSFYPGKNLGAAGDAGGVTTDDPDVARTVRLLAAHGSPSKYVHDVVGMNSRLDTVQAVYLLAKLARLEKWNELRREAAARYAELVRPGEPRRVAPVRGQDARARPAARRPRRRRHRRGHPLPDAGAPHAGLRAPGARPRHVPRRGAGGTADAVAADVPAPHDRPAGGGGGRRRRRAARLT